MCDTHWLAGVGCACACAWSGKSVTWDECLRWNVYLFFFHFSACEFLWRNDNRCCSRFLEELFITSLERKSLSFSSSARRRTNVNMRCCVPRSTIWSEANSSLSLQPKYSQFTRTSHEFESVHVVRVGTSIDLDVWWLLSALCWHVRYAVLWLVWDHRMRWLFRKHQTVCLAATWNGLSAECIFNILRAHKRRYSFVRTNKQWQRYELCLSVMLSNGVANRWSIVVSIAIRMNEARQLPSAKWVEVIILRIQRQKKANRSVRRACLWTLRALENLNVFNCNGRAWLVFVFTEEERKKAEINPLAGSRLKMACDGLSMNITLSALHVSAIFSSLYAAGYAHNAHCTSRHILREQSQFTRNVCAANRRMRVQHAFLRNWNWNWIQNARIEVICLNRIALQLAQNDGG